MYARQVWTSLACFLFVIFQPVCLEERSFSCPAGDLLTPQNDFKSLEESVRRLERQVALQSELIHKLERTLDQLRSNPGPLTSRQHSVDSVSHSHGQSDLMAIPTTVRRRVPFSDHFKFLSMAKTEGEITALRIFFLQGKTHALVGDSVGKIYLVQPSGDTIMERSIGSNAPIIHFGFSLIRKNSTTVLVGHQNGEVNQYYLETEKKPLENTLQVVRFAPGPIVHEASDRPLKDFHIGRYDRIKTAVFISYKSGEVEIFRLNGTLAHKMTLPSQVLAIKSDGYHTIIGHEVGMVMLFEGEEHDLNCTMPDGIRLKSLVFDAEKSTRAYGVTLTNDLVFIYVGKDPKRCLFKRRLNLDFPVNENVQVVSVSGYVVVASNMGVGIFNVTSPYKEGLVELSYDSFDVLMKSFDDKVEKMETVLVSAIAKKGGILSIHMSNGMIAFYKSMLPVYEQHSPDYGWIVRSVMFSVIIGVVVWQSTVKKRNKQKAQYQRMEENMPLPFEGPLERFMNNDDS